VGQPEAQAKLITHQAFVKSATIAQQIYITWKYKFLADSLILNWINKACFREEFPLGSLGLKKLATSESTFTKSSHLPTSEVCGHKPASHIRLQLQLIHC
jgi:hypothetical protein